MLSLTVFMPWFQYFDALMRKFLPSQGGNGRFGGFYQGRNR
jgi:hypothetical protein